MVNPDEIAKVSVIFTEDQFDAERKEQELIKLIPTKWNKKPFYKSECYQDWRNGEGLFAEVEVKDKQLKEINKGETPIIEIK